MERHFPRPSELLELMQFKKPELNGKKRRLSSALTINDLRTIAKRRTPKAAFDYTDGSADDEISLDRARQAFLDIEFSPSILRGLPDAVGRTAQYLYISSASAYQKPVAHLPITESTPLKNPF